MNINCIQINNSIHYSVICRPSTNIVWIGRITEADFVHVSQKLVEFRAFSWSIALIELTFYLFNPAPKTTLNIIDLLWFTN